MNLAVIGSGGREHAICYKLKQSPKLNKLVCIPGNAGTSSIAKNLDADILNFDSVYCIIKKHNIDIVIVGPEQPLAEGIVDYLNKKKIRVFGPDKFSAQLESSKKFMKDLCKKNNIPTAKYGVFNNLNGVSNFIKKNGLPIVVKADGLTAGKGVTICNTSSEALKSAKDIINGKFKSSNKVILEEFLDGEELSYFSIVDKNSYKFFGSAQDHKRVFENDVGPNTGGMGAYSPAPIINKSLEKKIIYKIVRPTLLALKRKKNPYNGFLYVGLMVKNNEPYLIEYNIRMGDPECQVILPRLKTDLVKIIKHSLLNKLEKIKLKWKKEKSMTIVLCSKGYPGNYKKNIKLKNINKVKLTKNDYIYHAGTRLINNQLLSSGGRVLSITSIGSSLIEIRKQIISIMKKINWKEGFYRRDIGWKVINKNENN
jgi:phosphoribosylamine--glycine ligase